MPVAAPAGLLSQAPFVYRYDVTAAAEPGVLPRLLELVAKRGLVPDRLICRRGEDGLAVRLDLLAVERPVAEHIARCMDQVVGVRTVGLSIDTATAAAA